jgi:hypothetical protein
MPSSSVPRRLDAYSNASASQKLGSYVCHDPIVPIRRTRRHRPYLRVARRCQETPKKPDSFSETGQVRPASRRWSQPGSNRRPPACKASRGILGSGPEILTFAGIFFLDSALVCRGRLPEYTRIFQDLHGRFGTECQNSAARGFRPSVQVYGSSEPGGVVHQPTEGETSAGGPSRVCHTRRPRRA